MLTREEHRRVMFELCIADITGPAHNRMRTRNAREEHELMLEELNREQDETVPDADDESVRSHFQ